MDQSPKKTKCRMLKAQCEGCGYTVRVTRKWLEMYGPPICPGPHTLPAQRMEAEVDNAPASL